MNTATRLGVAAAATLLIAGLTSAQGFDAELLRAYGQFEIGNGQLKTLARGKHDRMYRICVRKSDHSIPLKVMHDDVASMVYPGDCSDIEGMKIEITPGAKLDEDMTLVGRYAYLREDRAS